MVLPWVSVARSTLVRLATGGSCGLVTAALCGFCTVVLGDPTSAAFLSSFREGGAVASLVVLHLHCGCPALGLLCARFMLLGGRAMAPQTLKQIFAWRNLLNSRALMCTVVHKGAHIHYSRYQKYSDAFKIFTLCYIAGIC